FAPLLNDAAQYAKRYSLHIKRLATKSQ
ncbi:MAG: hypothetical protein RL703_331, partial [Pseudomonadota bacterium]